MKSAYKYFTFTILLSLIFTSSFCQAQTDEESYCISKGGKVVEMKPRIQTRRGFMYGKSINYCHFNVPTKDGGSRLAILGLDTFGSDKPNLAATFAKKINIDIKKPIIGPYKLNSYNICSTLGGGNIGYLYNGGMFDETKGESEMCFFGDGSSISGWTLIYIGAGTFDEIKSNIRSEYLDVSIPQIQKSMLLDE